jgi:serine/threonine protein kinase
VITTDVWQRVKDLVSDALERPESERAAFIADSGEDTTVRREAESMLAESVDRLEMCADDLQRVTDSGALPAGRRIGAYAIIRELGRGGMGTVYLAERADGAFQKQVAIKILKRGTDTNEVLRRFRAERQILARLHHSNIAALLDGGETEEGLPYFVMEYVDGKPITRYAHEHQLSVTDRLKLFRVVCSAIGFAHQNLVIHRDLKPSNVLVTNTGDLKLLDFGIAKLVQESEPDVTLTVYRMMTPEYASPEQVKGESVTTVSDVYSLGVLLYELLTGERPYKLKTRAQDEINRAIREQQPDRPSTALARLGSGKAQSAVRNSKLLRGDLDNIVLKALRKEPERRYASVDQLSADIRRHLEGLPVRARKITVAYRASKFVQRYKFSVAAVLLLALALLVGSVATAWEAHVAWLETKRAQRRFADLRKIANSLMFEFHDSIKDLPGALKARQLVTARAVEYLDSLVRDAGNDLSLRSELAHAYGKIGNVTFKVDEAIASHRKAVLLNEQLVQAAPKNALYKKQLSASYDALSDVMKIAGNSAEAIRYAKQGLAIIQPVASERASDLETQLALADRYVSLGVALSDAGNFKEALDIDLAGMSIQKRLSAEHPSDIEVQRRLSEFYGAISDAYEDLGDYANALNYGRDQMKITSEIFQSDSNSARSRRDMWSGYFRAGRQLAETGALGAAAENDSQATGLIESLAAADPSDLGHQRWLALTYFSNGNVLALADQPEKARESYDKAVAIEEHLVSADPDRVEARRDLSRIHWAEGQLLNKQGQVKRAVEELSKAASLAQASADQDPNNLRVRGRLAGICSDMARSYYRLAEQHGALTAGNSDLQKARDWYQRSFALWQELKSKSALREIDSRKLEEVTREIANCDAALK